MWPLGISSMERPLVALARKRRTSHGSGFDKLSGERDFTSILETSLMGLTGKDQASTPLLVTFTRDRETFVEGADGRLGKDAHCSQHP